ncbi:hypothetical protein LJC20_06220 [Eubacteriales bacterium OttesenSCG-928-M02]|nr:hypothetical protein [Eubacteriales bacterium OttesenSCG-928-M02]
MKKRIAILLCLALLLSMVPVLALPHVASAAPATTIDINGGAAVPSYTGGNGSYTFADGVLTLTDFKDTTNPITWTDGDLEIVVNGDCEVSGIGGSGSVGTLTISGTGKLIVTGADIEVVSLRNDLIIDGAEVKSIGTGSASVGVFIYGGNLLVKSGGSLEGAGNGSNGIYVASSSVDDGKGNIIVDGGTLKGTGDQGIQSNMGNITLLSGSITGIADGTGTGIYAMRQNDIGGKITVNGGTMTGTNTSTTSHQRANGIRAMHGMEITAGKVVAENQNPGAAALRVEGAALNMSGGELEATNTDGTFAAAANGVLAEAGITMTGNSKMTGTTESKRNGSGIRSYAAITLMGSDAGKPSMTGIGDIGIWVQDNSGNLSDIQVEGATIKGVGNSRSGIMCRILAVANSVADVESKNGIAIDCGELNLSGENTINATGADTAIYAQNTLKAVGNQYVRATATGVDGLYAVEPYGYGIVMNGSGDFDVNLTKGYIQATGMKGKLEFQGNVYNAGAGIAFFDDRIKVTLGANTIVEDGQVLINCDPAKDRFKQAYGKDGVVADKTVISVFVEEKPEEAPPATGDDANTTLWLWGMLGATLIAIAALYRRRIHRHP